MYTNAPSLLKNKSRTSFNNRHVLSSSDPPATNPFSSFSLFGHFPRRSDDGRFLGAADTSKSVSVGRSATTPTSTISAFAPSSFHPHSISRHVPSCSTSTITTYTTTHTKLAPRSTTATPSVSRSSSLSHRNNGNGPSNPAPVESASQKGPQRINMKSLMSKPIAILATDRAQSVMAFAAVPKDSDSQEGEYDEEEDHKHIRSRSLDILRRSKRRSRSVDMMMASEVEPPRSPTSPGAKGLVDGSGPSAFARLSVGRVSALTRSPSTPTTARPGRRSVDPDLDPHPRYPHGPIMKQTPPASPSPEFTLSPASEIARAWARSQKQKPKDQNDGDAPDLTVVDGIDANTAIEIGEAVTSSTIPQTAFAVLDSGDNRPLDALANGSITYTPMSPVLFADGHLRRRRLSSDQGSPLIIQNARGSNNGEITQSPEGEDFAWEKNGDEISSPSPFPSGVQSETVVSRHSTKDGRVDASHSVTATMREVSRRITGAFVGLGKEKKPTVARAALERPPTSLTIPSFIPLPNHSDTTTSPPSSFSVKPVPKASLSHDLRETSFSRTQTGTRSKLDTNQGITRELKNELPSGEQCLQLHDHPLSLTRPLLNPYPTAEFGQLERHTPLHFSLSSSSTTTSVSRNHRRGVSMQPPPLDMPGWLLPISSSKHASDHDDLQHVQELTLSRQTSTGSHWTTVTSPLSPAHSDHGRIPPPRSNTPNTLKKRSKPNLRKKPSTSMVAPVGVSPQQQQQHHHYATATQVPALEEVEGGGVAVTTTTTMASGGQGTGGKLRGLVKKLSSGALRRSSSQSDKSHSPPLPRESHGAATSTASSAGYIPPVPQIPKDFELILDPEAYFAERSRMREERVDYSDAESVPSTSACHNATLKVPGSSSQVSSRRSSFLGRKEQIASAEQQSMPSSLPSSLKSRLRVETELVPIPQRSSSMAPPQRQQQSSTQGAYSFPKRPNLKTDLSGSSNSQSTGTDHFGSATATGYRSSSPSISSTDLHIHRLYAAAASAAFEQRGSLSSHSHEMGSSYPQSLIAQPIMPPKDLYQHGEDEAAILRRQQNKESSSSRTLPRKKSFNPPSGSSQPSQSENPSPTTPPPLLSPLLLPLTAPPPRPPRRIAHAQSSIVLNDSTPRPTHSHQRSLSSPISPTIPTFLTNKPTNSIPLSKRSRSVGGSPRSPEATTEPPSPAASLTASQPSRARSFSLSKKGKNLPHLVLQPKKSESTKEPSPRPAPSEQNSPGERSKQPKVRVKTSLGTITRVKSMVTPKSASHTPSSSTSYTLSPQSSGRRSSSSRASRDHSIGHGWLTVDGEDAPPVPFTSTAFAFKENSSPAGNSASPGSARPIMTEGEREDLWNALLSRSDRVGGTLTLTEGPGLLSDQMSFREE